MERTLLLLILMLWPHVWVGAQSLDELRETLKNLVKHSAVSGREEVLADVIANRLHQHGLSPQIDSMSNVTVTVGSGKPSRLVIANIDEPGYVVSGITDDGYLRLQRIGADPPHYYFDQYFEGQRLTITTSTGAVAGVTAIPSTHLNSTRDRSVGAFRLSDAYVDVGAKSAAEVSRLGIGLMDAVSLEKTLTNLARDRVAGPFLSDRGGAAVLLEVLARTISTEINGTLTVAFSTQEHFGRKGLDRLSVQFSPDEVYIIEPENEGESSLPGASAFGQSSFPVWVDVEEAPRLRKILGRFEGLIQRASLRSVPNAPQWKVDTEVIRIGIPVKFLLSPVEVLDLKHLQSTIRFLRAIVQSGVS